MHCYCGEVQSESVDLVFGGYGIHSKVSGEDGRLVFQSPSSYISDMNS